MNALQMARTAYTTSAPATRTDRSIEYDAFARVTHRLKKATENRKDFAGLAAALHENRRLWTLLASDVSDPANGLPKSLRAQIFYLAEFTSQQTSRVLKGDANPVALLEINVAIMRGLRAKGDSK